MAAADYRMCDVCNCKTFYDSNLDYEHATTLDDPDVFKVAGKPQPWGHKLFRLGDWAVICIKCAETHRTQIVRIDGTNPAAAIAGAGSDGVQG